MTNMAARSVKPETDSGAISTQVECSHCGLPVPAPLVRADRTEQFCCGGCEAVYGILHDCDLDEYYRLRNELATDKPRPAQVSGKDFSYFDDPEFLRKYSTSHTKSALRVQLFIEGVHCIACSWLIEKVLMEREGAAFARLNMGSSILEVVFDPTQIKLSRVAAILDSIGYTPHPIRDDSITEAARRETRSLLIRIGIAGAAAGNIMLLAVSLYAGEYTGIDVDQANLFRWLSFGLTLPALLYSAMPFYRGAWAGLRHGMLHMDLPISLGIVSAFVVSFISTILERGEVFYDTLTALIFLLLCGRLVLNRATRWAAGTSEKLLELEPRTARLLEGGVDREVALSDVHTGSRLRVLPGETVPVDGILESGTAVLGEAHLTGESKAVTKQQGDKLFAGSSVEQQPLEMTATAVGETTRLAKLARMMSEASLQRAPIVALHDRIAGYFVAAVLILAVTTGIIWAVIDPSKALWNAAALLVITCPCALGLGTPVALAVAMGRAARRGLFVKGQDGIERLSKIRRVILDKTGTLTEGKLKLVTTHYVDSLSESEKHSILEAVAGMEKLSGHSIATAFSETRSTAHVIHDFRAITGSGLTATVDSSEYVVGSEKFMRELGCDVPSPLLDMAAKAAEQSMSTIYAARDKKVVASFVLGDPIRAGAQKSVNELKRMGLEIEILSGDHPDVVASVARQLDIVEYQGRVSPEAKLQRVEELESSGTATAMIGDGVNDAAALSRATAGISVAGATEIARDAADVFVSRRGPAAIADLFHFSRRSMKVVKLNIVIAIFYNIVGAALAMTGHVSPLVAAVLMPISSLTVLLIATKA